MRGSVRSACGCTRPRWAKTRRRSSRWRSRGRSSAARARMANRRPRAAVVRSRAAVRFARLGARACRSRRGSRDDPASAGDANRTCEDVAPAVAHPRSAHASDAGAARSRVASAAGRHRCRQLELDVAPGLIVQGTLLTRTLPSPDDLATLTSRLCALMGDTRVGAPALVETHDERQSTMGMFLARGPRPKAQGPRDGNPENPKTSTFIPCLRRYRLPLAVTVEVERGRPATVRSTARGIPGGDVVNVAGPWRTSGGWWAPDQQHWDRDEWDVELVSGGCYRLVRNRITGRWEIEGEMD